MTVIAKGTGRADYSQDIATTVMPDIGGKSIGQDKLYYKTTVTIAANTTTTYNLVGVVVAENHKWEIYDASASGDTNLLIDASLIRDSDSYYFVSNHGYGSVKVTIQKGFDIGAGDTIKFNITNYDDVNAHEFYFNFYGLDITLAP